jgi:hypothetical protein
MPHLRFSLTGFENQEIGVDGRSMIDVRMVEGVKLDEVVVTALGISREKKALGYSNHRSRRKRACRSQRK